MRVMRGPAVGKRTRLLLVSELELNFEINCDLFDFFVTLIWDSGVIVPGYFKAMGKRTRLLLVSELELNFEINFNLFDFLSH